MSATTLSVRVLPSAGRDLLAWRERVADTQATLARERALLAAAPMLRDSVDGALRQVVALAPTLLSGDTPAEASATLASLVTLGANRHGLRVLSVSPLPDSAAGVFDRVTVRADLEGDVRGFTALLGAVETGTPLLTITQLAVDAPAPTSQPSTPEALRIGVTVAGYALVRRAP